MGRLFWKLFFSFWLALLTVALVVGGIFSLFRPDSSSQQFPDGPGALALKSAIVALNYGGQEALQELLISIERDDFPVMLYAVDDLGNDILSRPVPADTLELAYQFVETYPTNDLVRYFELDNRQELLLFSPEWLSQNILAQGSQLPEPALGDPALFRPPPFVPSPPWWAPWLLSLMGLLASILFSAMLAWYLAAPVRHLRRAFSAAESGELEMRVQPLIGQRRDEIADLGHAYDTMATKLNDLIYAQKNLFHDVSHELRSPLARLHAATGLLKQDPGKVNLLIERIEQEVERLDSLVGEILVLARLESGVVKSYQPEVELSDLMDEIIADACFEAEVNSCQVDYTGTSQRVIMNGNVELLARAMDNIIRNAIKYTQASSKILVKAAFDAKLSQFQVEVSDHGPGVPEDELDSIFKPFYRSKHSDNHQGYGLGLAIAKKNYRST